MTNVAHHAYDDKNEEKRWWCFSQLKDGRLAIVFSDLGVGIPEKIKDTHPVWYKNWFEVVKYPKDGNLLHSLAKKPRSSTGHEFRGKGIKQLIEMTKIEGTRVFIHSNKGSIFVDTDSNSASQIRILKKSYKFSINGTMISISIPFLT